MALVGFAGKNGPIPNSGARSQPGTAQRADDAACDQSGKVELGNNGPLLQDPIPHRFDPVEHGQSAAREQFNFDLLAERELGERLFGLGSPGSKKGTGPFHLEPHQFDELGSRVSRQQVIA